MISKLKTFTLVACGLVGTSVLVSWATDFSFGPSSLRSVAMNPLTAVCFVLCGLAAFFADPIRRILGGVIFVLAFLKLMSFFGFDFHVDQVLFSQALEARADIPNRMAPLTTINFLLMGLVFVFFETRWKGPYPLSNFLLIPVFFIAVVGAIGYSMAALGLTQLGSFIPMAFNTTLVFIGLCFCIWFMFGEQGLLGVFLKNTPASRVGLRLLPAVLLAPVVLGYLGTLGQDHEVIRAENALALMAVSWTVIGFVILWLTTSAIHRLEENLETTNRKEAESRIGRLKKFFPPSIAEMIASGKIEDPFKWRREDITVIFIDIRGFTQFSESEDPDEVMQMLQTYYTTVAKIAQKHQGTIGHLAGDGVMIFFNAPVAIENPQLKAVRMALEMREELQKTWQKFRYHEQNLDFGAGIASGFTTIGGIGEEGFWDYTVIGSTSNVASRLCNAAHDGQILVSRRFLAKLGAPTEAEALGPLELKGIPKPVDAFNIKNVF